MNLSADSYRDLMKLLRPKLSLTNIVDIATDFGMRTDGSIGLYDRLGGDGTD